MSRPTDSQKDSHLPDGHLPDGMAKGTPMSTDNEMDSHLRKGPTRQEAKDSHVPLLWVKR